MDTSLSNIEASESIQMPKTAPAKKFTSSLVNLCCAWRKRIWQKMSYG